MARQSKRPSLNVTAVTGIAFAAFVMVAPMFAGGVSAAPAKATGGTNAASEPAPQAKPRRPMAPQTPPPPPPPSSAALQTLTPPSVMVRRAPPPRAIAPVAKPTARPVTIQTIKPVAHPKPPVVKKPSVRKKSAPGRKKKKSVARR